LISFLISAARELVEKEANLPLLPQTWELALDSWPSFPVRLPRAPVSSIVSITYLDPLNALQTLSPSGYVLRGGQPSRLDIVGGFVLPALSDQIEAVRVRMICGFADAASVPNRAKQAIRFLAAHWYENREAVNIGNITSELPLGWANLIESLRIENYS
jgi:uncharacterized phiE125 gp8 family phage protein